MSVSESFRDGRESTERQSLREITKPGEAEAANEQRPGISEKFRRRFENVVQARASDTRQTCDADNQESVGADSLRRKSAWRI